MRQLKQLAVPSALSVLIWVFFKVTTAPDLDEMTSFGRDSLMYLISTFCITLMVWEVTRRMMNRFQRKHGPRLLTWPVLARFSVLTLAIHVVLLIPFLLFMKLYLEVWFDCEDSTQSLGAEIIQDFLGSMFFSVLIITGFIVYRFSVFKKQSELVQERMLKENIFFKYESLKNQLNPHFLFNSFSVLTSLVHKNPDLASDFIVQLSKIYRYVLQNREKDLVSLEEELAFLRSYLFLLQIRHDDSIQVEYEVQDKYLQCRIPTLSLQLLAENAAKHNSFTQERPLVLRVHTEDESYLVVENNVQHREKNELSTGVGLENIRKRYELNEQDHPVILQTDERFVVKLPLIEPLAS